jgi:hypothetical protein
MTLTKKYLRMKSKLIRSKKFVLLGLFIHFSVIYTFGQSNEPPYGITGYGNWAETYTVNSSHVYYLDAINGDDTYNGLSSTVNTTAKTGPWKTLTKAQTAIASGYTFYMATGNYGDFIYGFTANMTDWVTFKALDPNNPPVIGNVYISSQYAVNRDFYLRLDGIDFQVYNGSMTATNIPYSIGISFNYGNYIEIRNSEIHDRGNVKYHIHLAVNGIDCNHLLFYKNNIHHVQAGIDATNCTKMTVSQNYIHNLAAGAGLVQRTFTSDCIFEYNHIFDSDYSLSDVCTLHSSAGGGCAHVRNWDNDPPHCSGLNILHSNIIMRGNIVHYIGSTAGLTFYGNLIGTGVPCFTNVLIENNLIYDVINPYYTFNIMDKLGNNITIRNNTLVASSLYSNVAAAAMGFGLGTESSYMATGYDGSGVHIYNNVVVGRMAGLPLTFDMKNNIMWAYSTPNDSYTYINPPATNAVGVTTASGGDFNTLIRYFTNGFFKGLDGAEDVAPKHHQTLDFSLTATSSAVNFGDPTHQPSESLGTLDTNGFIQKNGATRDASHHSAGAYEYGTSSDLPSYRKSEAFATPYPNPFNPNNGQSLMFSNLSRNNILSIYDISGSLIWEYTTSDSQAHWNGKTSQGQIVGSGIYIYTIRDEQGNFKTGKTIVAP